MIEFLPNNPDETREGGNQVLLLHPRFQALESREDMAEFRELATSAGLEVCAEIEAPRGSPHAATLVGKGKVQEIADLMQEHCWDTVLVNHALSPIQERNLEKIINRRVHDRNTLILDIFAQRARSHEGKLQVELAQLKHLSTRLVRGWTHLERQKGGIGLRGPGETQLETDRRLLGARVRTLNKRLAKLTRQRRQSRRARSRSDVPLVSLVGYTNAGKSTLFNRLTDGEVYAADQLFATLDPTLRRLESAKGMDIVLADTVGFIRHLPHELVAAFKSTLEETRDADLLLHVVDASDPLRDERVEAVTGVLEEIGAGEVPQIVVNNKIDALGLPAQRQQHDGAERVWVSAQTGEGIELLMTAVREHLSGRLQQFDMALDAGDGRLRARLYSLGCVDNETPLDDGGWRLSCAMAGREREMLEREWPGRFDQIPPSSCPVESAEVANAATSSVAAAGRQL
ncbi:MAG: ribosome rescue GTPase HflX [Lysobacterales bacterium]